jgi:hypothetical protein
VADFIAIKKLSNSDLTLLDRFFGESNDSGQKCINLNARPFSKDHKKNGWKAFYPTIEAAAEPTDGEVAVDLYIYGPAAKGQHGKLLRKITKGDTYKNWRLNGETVHDPKDDKDRYAPLQQHDLAVMAFEGTGRPKAVRMVYLARASAADKPLYDALEPLVAEQSMVPVTPEQLAAAMAAVGAPATHPLALFAVDEEIEAALEDAAQGGSAGQRILRKRRGGKTMTATEAAERRKAAAQAGADGEALVNAWLKGRTNPGGDFAFEWVAKDDPEGPFDFLVSSKGGAMGTTKAKVDVKSTKGPFGRMFHISMGEILEAAESEVPYHVWRVFNIGPSGAVMRQSGDIREFAKKLVAACSCAMPPGVRAEDFTVQVNSPGLSWGGDIALPPSAPGEEDESDTDEEEEAEAGA